LSDLSFDRLSSSSHLDEMRPQTQVLNIYSIDADQSIRVQLCSSLDVTISKSS
jgi:hypothetical protein